MLDPFLRLHAIDDSRRARWVGLQHDRFASETLPKLLAERIAILVLWVIRTLLAADFGAVLARLRIASPNLVLAPVGLAIAAALPAPLSVNSLLAMVCDPEIKLPVSTARWSWLV